MTNFSPTTVKDYEEQDAVQSSGESLLLASHNSSVLHFESARNHYPLESPYAYEQEGSADARPSLSVRRPTGFAGVNETWDDYTNVDARIIEIGDDWVRLDCLIDSENHVFQERLFQRGWLEGALPVRIGAYVLIRIFMSPGKVKYTFTDGEKYVRKGSFEDDSWFADLEDAGLDEMLR